MRKKSNYKPRAVIADVMSYVKSGLLPLASIGDEAVKLKLRNHDALNKLRLGEGTHNDADIVLTAMNVAEALARDVKLGVDWLAEIDAAQEAVASLCERGLSTGRYVFRGPELVAINLAMDVHDAQLDACTVHDMERAINYTKAVIRAGGARRLGAA